MKSWTSSSGKLLFKFKAGVNALFLSMLLSLSASAQSASASKVVSGMVQASRMGVRRLVRNPALGASTVALEYAIQPESITASKVADLFDWGGLSSCTSPVCHEFMKDCALKIKSRQAENAEVLQRDLQFDQCIDDFFKLPLQVQSQMRRDGDFDRIVRSYSPQVRELSCRSETEIQVQTFDSIAKLSDQKISFLKTGAPLRVTWQRDEVKANYLTGEPGGGEALLQNCETGRPCDNYSMAQVHSIKTFPWLNRMYPLQSLKWVKAQERLLKYQSRAIYQCCQSTSCQSYFRHPTAHVANSGNLGAK